MKLLIADDDLTQRMMLEVITRKWGFDSVIAEDGQAAWDILRGKDAPDLILLDWEMPVKNGLELCRLLRTRKVDISPYIILLTARKETDDIVLGLEAGANDYVSKPFESTELEARLKVGQRMINLQIELNRTRSELAFQARHDVLTGLMNRRAILEVMEQEISRADREVADLYIGMCDIDHFKQVNDSYGHLAGDAVLKEVAQRIGQALRPYDRIGRYGGEEFLILIHSEPEQACGVFERMRLVIAESPIVFERQNITVSISCGVNSFRADSIAANSTRLLSAADELLYKAKQNGRNRIEFKA